MELDLKDIEALEKRKRIQLINAITGIKPANLVGTVSRSGQTNLAIFSSVMHLGSNPALLGFILRPSGEVVRHTYENLKETGFYTINHVHQQIVQQAHQTSGKFSREVSEFEACGLTEEWHHNFPAPYVAQIRIRIGMKFEQEIPIPLNGTSLVIGSIQQIFIPDEYVNDSGLIDLEGAGSTGVTGLNGYYRVQKFWEE